jgi:hypothetical protein
LPWQRFVIWAIGHHDALDDSLITISDRHLIDRCPDASCPRVQTASPSKHETAVGQTSSATICCAAVDIWVFPLLMCSRNDDVDRLFGSHQVARSETPMVLGAIRSCWRLHRLPALAGCADSRRSYSPNAPILLCPTTHLDASAASTDAAKFSLASLFQILFLHTSAGRTDARYGTLASAETHSSAGGQTLTPKVSQRDIYFPRAFGFLFLEMGSRGLHALRPSVSFAAAGGCGEDRIFGIASFW